MTLRHLRIRGLRCLSEVELDLDPGRNYLWGPNGAGKTSILEAIYVLGRGRSFRLRQTAGLIRHGQDSFSVFGIVAGEDGRDMRLGVEFRSGRLSIQRDGEAVASQAEMLRALPVHVLDPGLHQLVEAGPSERRRFIDSGVFHVEQQFLGDWRRYRRVLGQRNAALKANLPSSQLEIWSEPLIEAAEAVHRARADYLTDLSQLAEDMARQLVGFPIRLKYRPGWRQDVTFSEALKESVQRDRAAGFTQVGPHRADLRLDFDVGGVRELASRGQQKLVAAALIVSQVRLFETRTGRKGTVLVDDASAELDQNAQQRLGDALDTVQSQLLLTGLSLDALAPRPGLPVFHVEQGSIKSVV